MKKDLQIMRRPFTHEQVWMIRDEARRGVLSPLAWARRLRISPTTVKARVGRSDPIWYPEFPTIEDARRRDSLRRYCLDVAD